ncbi:endolytic transglycosylase MltG [Gordonia sp. TBRC 11910]|uniref:Endolytic murein transglycosylase n=1 Tax=Gordonia asplenii TaxID=2725283 RepID=A0A848KXD9_9ACTN|nr:endolytic transglycosylase MltG [Gordonia asplenii]
MWFTGEVPLVDDVVDEGTGRVLPQRVEPGRRYASREPEPAQDEGPGEPNIRRHVPSGRETVAQSRPVDVPAVEGPAVDDETTDEPLDDTAVDEAAALDRSRAGTHDDTVADELSEWQREFPRESGVDEASVGQPSVTHQAYSEVEDTDDPVYPFDDNDHRDDGSAARRRRRSIVLAVVVVCLLAMVGGIGYFGLRFLGVVGASDYSNANGTGDVLVTIPDNSTLRDFGQILTDKHVVGSVKAFTRAADGKTLAAGIYKLRTEIPAAKAVQMLDDSQMTYRVGRVVIPEGVQLDSKTGIDGKVTPGIFELIAEATSTTINGTPVGVTSDALSKAAAEATVDQLGIPQWAKTEVTALDGDHRRIEGLIAPGTWETVDPSASATDILRTLITDSARRYEQWGLLSANESGLSPYETLTAASVVEREVSHPDDFAKVARVILNRLKDGQRLEMDSTANYTAAITNIDVHGDAYKADNKWNTYRVKGLPPSPIASVGQKALEAIEHPAVGDWKYFITVDKEGTTLFAASFDEHKKNREKACANKFLTVGCS